VAGLHAILVFIRSQSPPNRHSMLELRLAARHRLLAAKLREQYGACPNMTIGHPACCEVVALQQSLNLVANINPPLSTDGVYGDQTAIAVANFQKFMNGLGANIKDFPGAALEGTRWWLCVCLQNIRDGK